MTVCTCCGGQDALTRRRKAVSLRYKPRTRVGLVNKFRQCTHEITALTLLNHSLVELTGALGVALKGGDLRLVLKHQPPAGQLGIRKRISLRRSFEVASIEMGETEMQFNPGAALRCAWLGERAGHLKGTQALLPALCCAIGQTEASPAGVTRAVLSLGLGSLSLEKLDGRVGLELRERDFPA